MSRAPRPWVAKLNDQRVGTSSRFWKPIRYERHTHRFDERCDEEVALYVEDDKASATKAIATTHETNA